MNLVNRLRGAQAPVAAPATSGERMTFGDLLAQMSFGGHTYPLGQNLSPITTQAGTTIEPIATSFEGLVRGAYQSNGVVFACSLARQMLFSEARFQYQELRGGRPGNLFGDKTLALLESPWPNGTTGNLLARMSQDVDFAGNFFGALRTIGGVRQFRRLRPDWVDIVRGSRTGHEIDEEIIGYAYWENGTRGGKPMVLLPEEVCHFAPIPDPLAKFRGMSWLQPVLREVEADAGMREHKIAFLRNAATPNLVVTLSDQVSPEAFAAFVDAFEEDHAGAINAYRTLYFGGGADTKVVGSDLRQLDFANVQGVGELAIANAAGVPAIVAGLSEGLKNGTYSNFESAMRRMADGTARPWWRDAAASLAQTVPVPAGSRLWYDDRDIAWLQQDAKVAAEIQQVEAITMRQLIDGGYEPDAVTDAVTAGDLKRLNKKHTGYVSVQLQLPGAGQNQPSRASLRAALRSLDDTDAGPASPKTA